MYEISIDTCALVSGGFLEGSSLSDLEQFSLEFKSAGDNVINSGTLAAHYIWDQNNKDGSGKLGDYRWWATDEKDIILLDTNHEYGPDTSVQKLNDTLYVVTSEVGSEQYIPIINKGPANELFDAVFGDAKAALNSLLERYGDTASSLARRDDASSFNRDNVADYYQNNNFFGYIDNNNHNVIWLDRNNNGQPETVLKFFPGGQIWQDTNFDGTWDRRVR